MGRQSNCLSLTSGSSTGGRPLGWCWRGQFLNRLFQSAKLDRLGEMECKPGGAALLDVIERTESGESDARQGTAGTDRRHQLQASAVGELDIADEQVEVCFRREP